jgi:hypothetical protein
MAHENGGWMNGDQREAVEPHLPIEEDVTRAYVDGRNAGRTEERARVRRELLEALPMECLTSGEPYYKGWSAAAEAVRAALDRICPGEE